MSRSGAGALTGLSARRHPLTTITWITCTGEMRGPIITRSFVSAPPERVWQHVTSAAGINDELRPILRMTAPRLVRERGLAAVEVGQRICRSWVLLFGVLPIDYDDITLARMDPPRSFLERSTMLSQRRWEHERTIETVAGGSTVTDRIRYQPRLPVPDILLRPIYQAIFRHRHRRLQRHFGKR